MRPKSPFVSLFNPLFQGFVAVLHSQSESDSVSDSERESSGETDRQTARQREKERVSESVRGRNVETDRKASKETSLTECEGETSTQRWLYKAHTYRYTQSTHIQRDGRREIL